ncbi:methyltransferase domain-containing protein [Burkholderia stagnalis]|uniref:methyltransferase domain-containing protein n=1 Tax=Burkholderia stagnalis TaxID=1503054 RepID=UPI001F49A50A|nr:class I SAM-dependent methyltransferase [Burkholderia stagnalis]
MIEIGSQDVNGSLRSVFPDDVSYTGVDFVAGRGVDVVLQDPYVLPFEDASADIVLASSVFEHSEMFWLLFLEVMRILKPAGLFYLNVPSNGDFHRWPVDCWRFYPDSGNALVTWGKRNGMKPMLLESYTSLQRTDQWNDFVAVFLKDDHFTQRYPKRILHTKRDFQNGIVSDEPDRFFNYSMLPQDRIRLQIIRQALAQALS